jgi:DNA repair protein RadC
MKKVLRRQEELNLDREHFWVMGLNIHQWILYLELVSLGTVDATLVDPMSVFSFALQKSACNIVLIHNHPSGDLVPSDKDKDVTDRMIQVGKILYTPVLDHLVISMRTYLRFLDAGIMEELEESTKWEPSYVTQERIRKQAEELGRKVGRLEGLKEGEKKGIEIGVKRGLEEGKRDGIEIGVKRGLEEGEKKGRDLGKLEGLEEGEKKGIEIGQRRGLKEGRKLGKLEGREEGRRKVAAELKRMGADRSMILKSTGISEEELDSL